MLVIDISINRKQILFELGAVRIKPKEGVQNGDICTYSLLKVKTNEYIDKKVKYPYGDSLLLSKELIGTFKEELEDKTYEINKDDILCIDISLNRNVYTHEFIVIKDKLYFLLDGTLKSKILVKKELKLKENVLEDFFYLLDQAINSNVKFDQQRECLKIQKMFDFDRR